MVSSRFGSKHCFRVVDSNWFGRHYQMDCPVATKLKTMLVQHQSVGASLEVAAENSVGVD